MKSTLFTLLVLAGMPMTILAEEVDGINYSFNKENKTAQVTKTYYQGDMVIPETVSFEGIEYTVNSIANGAFASNNALTSATIGKGVKTIGTEAFAGCPRMTSLTLPKGLETIGDSAFWICRGLKQVTIPSSVTSIGTSAFAECSKVEDVIVGIGKKNIGKRAFAICPKLKSVTLMSSEVNYGDDAFMGDLNLATVRLSSKEPAAIGNNPFPTRANINLLVPEKSIEAYKTADYWKDFKDFKDFNDFNQNDSYQNDSYRNLCGQCGDDAYWLYDGDNHTLTIFGSGPMKDLKDCNNNHLASYYFLRIDIYTVIVEDGITHIGNSNFYNYFGDYVNMHTVILGNDVKSIGEDAFAGSWHLASINLNRVETIGDYAFYKCSALKEVTFSNSLKTIGQLAFGLCWKLTSVNFPKDVKEIDNDAFNSVGNDKNPCSLIVPDGFDFGEDVDSTGEYFWWKNGVFRLANPMNTNTDGDESEGGFEFNSSENDGASSEMGEDLNSDNQVVWYTVNGEKLNGKPTQSGIYLMNGHKVYLP